MPDQPDDPPAAPVDTVGPTPATPRYSSAELLAGGAEAHIAHDGQHYRLRRTRNGKLILTK